MTTQLSFQQPLEDLKNELNGSLIERQGEVEALILALVSRQHLLLVGPPGTAKSLLCNSLRVGLNCREFARLLTKFTAPEELFGPFDLNKLAPTNGSPSQYERITAGYLPEAEIAFLDEIWKGSSAILNTLLEIMNERTFSNGTSKIHTPVRTIVAGSNEYPVGEGHQELAAAFDRFLIRREVRPVSPAGMDRLLWGTLNSPKAGVCSVAHIDAAHAHSQTIPIDQSAKDAYLEIMAELRTAQIAPGDRRLRASANVARAAAVVDGSPVVLAKHLECLADTLWTDPGTISKTKQIVLQVVNPGALKILNLIAQLQDVIDPANLQKGDKNKAVEAINKMKEIKKDLQQLSHLPNAAEAIAMVESQQTALSKSAFGL